MTKSKLFYLLKIIIFAVAYHIAARIGLLMAYVQPNTSPVWPPTGISIAILLISGINLWPGITLGVFVGSLITGAPLNIAFGMAVGNTLEAVVTVLALRKFMDFHDSLDRINDVIGLTVVSLFSTAISATIGTSTLILATQTPSSTFFDIWFTWWIGDLLGALVVAPTILVWAKPISIKGKWKSILEGVGLIVLIILITWYVFSNIPPINVTHQAMIYVIFPFVIWAALRFGQHGATAGISLISAIAIWGTVSGSGPFALESINNSLILLQTFMGVVSITSLILAATSIEKRNAALALQHRIDDLDKLNSASKSFLGNFDKASINQIICKIAVEKFDSDCAWIEMASGENEPLIFSTAYGISLEEIQQLNTLWDSQENTKINEEIIIDSNKTYRSYQSFGVFPLRFGNKTLGALNILSEHKDNFIEEKQTLIQSFANLAAVAIQNAWLFDEVRRGNEQLHALSQRLMKAQEEERLHLSRELHDESGQLIAALMMELGLVVRENKKNNSISKQISKIRESLQDLQNNLHRLAVNLRPASLDHLGLITAIEQFVHDFSKQYRIEVDFEVVGMENRRFPLEVETSLFRIIQETLTNVALHADATQVDILLSNRNKHVTVIIEDNGIGFIMSEPIVENKLGLFGMKERVEMLDGIFTLESAPGKGTTVKVEVPFGD